MPAIIAHYISEVARSKWTKYTALGLITLQLLRKVKRHAANRKIQSVYASKIEEAQREREENIAWAREETKFVTDEERKLVESMDFRQLREALQSGKVTAEIVVRVYYGLAIKAHEKTNCLTNICKGSLGEARKLDELAKSLSYKKPRLFGIPISIKDSIELAGHRNTWGLAKLADKIAKEDSYHVKRLRMEGMVPFCQTSLPTTFMTYNCSNTIYGTTSCPQDPSRSSGGSSGGEGALIAAGGSLIGLGSDLGGSIRIPAAHSGCCGFKPSSTRFSTLQIREAMAWRPMLTLTEGPLAADPHAIVEIMRVMWSDHFLSNEDPLSVPIDFREDLFKEGRKYRIGVFTSDGYIDPLPGNQRVVREAAELLKAKGHEVVSFSMEDIVTEAARGVFSTAFSDGGKKMAAKLDNEPFEPLMRPFRDNALMPLWKRKLIGWLCKLRGDKTTADCCLVQSNMAVDLQDGFDRVDECRKRLVQKMKDERIDLLLCPPTISPAMPHSLPNDIPFTAILATMLWNALDFPAGVVTTSKWTEEDEEALKSYTEKGIVEAGIKKGCKNSVGLPLSVQIVAPAFRDESVLRVMVDLYDSVKEERNKVIL